MSRLREGRANTARGAAHFLRETVGHAANGRLTGRQRVLHSWRGIRLPQDGCPLLHHHSTLHNLIEATRRCLDADRMDGAADVAETTCTPFQAEADAAPVAHRPAGEADARFPTPSSPNTAIMASSPTGTGSCSNWRLTIAATPRSRMPYATSSTASG